MTLEIHALVVMVLEFMHFLTSPFPSDCRLLGTLFIYNSTKERWWKSLTLRPVLSHASFFSEMHQQTRSTQMLQGSWHDQSSTRQWEHLVSHWWRIISKAGEGIWSTVRYVIWLLWISLGFHIRYFITCKQHQAPFSFGFSCLGYHFINKTTFGSCFANKKTLPQAPHEKLMLAPSFTFITLAQQEVVKSSWPD